MWGWRESGLSAWECLQQTGDKPQPEGPVISDAQHAAGVRYEIVQSHGTSVAAKSAPKSRQIVLDHAAVQLTTRYMAGAWSAMRAKRRRTSVQQCGTTRGKKLRHSVRQRVAGAKLCERSSRKRTQCSCQLSVECRSRATPFERRNRAQSRAVRKYGKDVYYDPSPPRRRITDLRKQAQQSLSTTERVMTPPSAFRARKRREMVMRYENTERSRHARLKTQQRITWQCTPPGSKRNGIQ